MCTKIPGQTGQTDPYFLFSGSTRVSSLQGEQVAGSHICIICMNHVATVVQLYPITSNSFAFEGAAGTSMLLCNVGSKMGETETS